MDLNAKVEQQLGGLMLQIIQQQAVIEEQAKKIAELEAERTAAQTEAKPTKKKE